MAMEGVEGVGKSGGVGEEEMSSGGGQTRFD